MKPATRRHLSLLLALWMLLFALPAPAQVAPPQAYLNYDNRDGKLILRSAESAVDLVIPAEVSGHPVIEIAANAFLDSPNLSRVTVPASVTYISANAFAYCSQLIEFVVDGANPNYSAVGGGLYDKSGETLIRFAEGASGEISMPAGLRYVDANAFENCAGLTSVKFQEGLEEIGGGAFLNCASLKSLDLPQSLGVMPPISPFQNCPSLTKISVAKENPSYQSRDGALYDKDGRTLVAYPGATGVVTLPDGVVTIGSGAFSGAAGLTEIRLPQGLYQIEPLAFAGCSALSRVEIPDGTALIGRYAFNGCAGLALAVVPDSVIDIGDGAFPETAIIQCAEGSAADLFAQQAGLRRQSADPASGEVRDPESGDGEHWEGFQDITGGDTLEPAPGGVYGTVLQALGDDLISATYSYLLQGNTIEKGAKTDELKGLQQLLNLLGAELEVDGSIGAKSIAALNQAQAEHALPKTQSVSQSEFEALLAAAYIARDPGSARELLGGEYAEHIDYSLAVSEAQRQNFFTAYSLFAGLGDYLDSRKRAENCRQKWPKDGQIYRNPAFSGEQTELTVVTSLDKQYATYLKVYTENGQRVAGAFIAGSGKVTLKLPGGSYVFKVGTGAAWFGENEAFGRDFEGSRYSRLTFEGGADTAYFKPNYRYTLTLGGDEDNNVGSKAEDPDDF